MASESPPPFLRLFIAVTVPPPVRAEIERAQGQLRRGLPAGAVRWTRPEQFHVTLKFLGDVPPAQFAALRKAVSTVCAGFPSLTISSRGVGFFPARRAPRVIWAGAADAAGGLEALHARLDEATGLFAPADRPGKFTGHITLGRFKPGRRFALEKVHERAEALRDRHFGDWSAGAVEIVRCVLQADGAWHQRLAACPLAG